ncbi:hypothetical protein [Flavobacterium sp.]|jgi:hypothetical protein|uniref:hypothetical protein n=1 Tax=Flavobacterium sp. TaxID=239 RepID=UPI0037BEE120
MDVLKKIKSATLVESLVATVLIVIIFVVSSLIINNLLLNGFNNNTTEIENRLYELEYEYQNKKILLPYQERYQNWNIVIEKNTNSIIEFKARKEQSLKVIVKTRIDE